MPTVALTFLVLSFSWMLIFLYMAKNHYICKYYVGSLELPSKEVM